MYSGVEALNCKEHLQNQGQELSINTSLSFLMLLKIDQSEKK